MPQKTRTPRVFDESEFDTQPLPPPASASGMKGTPSATGTTAPIPPPPILTRLVDFGGDIAGSVARGAYGFGVNIIKGAAKEATKRVISGGKMIESIPGVGPALRDMPSFTYKGNLEAEGFGQKVGQFGEQALEYYIPSGVVGQLERSAEGVVKGLTMIGPKLKTALNITARGATEGTAAGLVSATQGGTTADAEAMGTMVALTEPIRYMLAESTAPRWIQSLLKRRGASDKTVQFGKDPIGGVLREKVSAPTIGGLVEKIENKITELTKDQLDPLLKSNYAQSQKIDAITAFLNPILEATNSANKEGNTALAKRLAVYAQAKVEQIYDINKAGLLTPWEMQQLKREVGHSMTWNEYDTIERTLDQVRYKVYFSFDNAIDHVIPPAKEINERISSLIGASGRAKMKFEEFQNSPLLKGTGLAEKALLAPLSLVESVIGKPGSVETTAKTYGARFMRALHPTYYPEPGALPSIPLREPGGGAPGHWYWTPQPPAGGSGLATGEGRTGGWVFKQPQLAQGTRLQLGPGPERGAFEGEAPIKGYFQLTPEEAQLLLQSGPVRKALQAGPPPPKQLQAGPALSLPEGQGIIPRGANLGEPGPLPPRREATITPTSTKTKTVKAKIRKQPPSSKVVHSPAARKLLPLP